MDQQRAGVNGIKQETVLTMTYRSRFACGHSLISEEIKPKVGDLVMCPEHGETTIVEVEKGTIKAYIGFVPSPFSTQCQS